jgi:hypothetical protein
MFNRIFKGWALLSYIAIGIIFLLTPFFIRAEKSSIGIENFAFDLLGNNGKPSSSLLKLLDVCDVSHDGSLNDIIEKTQSQWLRKDGEERWHIKNVFQEKTDKIVEIFKELRIFETIKPAKKNYGYLIFLGSTLQHMRRKLAYVINLWNEGVRFNQLVFLVGQRKRDSKIEADNILYDETILKFRKDYSFNTKGIFESEFDLAKLMYGQVEIPLDMKKVETFFVNAPERVVDDKVRRPDTQSTICCWLESNPKPGSCLVVTSQPFCRRHHVLMKMLLPSSFSYEVVGFGCENQEKQYRGNVSVGLDEIARWLYQEYKCITAGEK